MVSQPFDDVTAAAVTCPKCEHRFIVKVDGDKAKAEALLVEIVYAHVKSEHPNTETAP